MHTYTVTVTITVHANDDTAAIGLVDSALEDWADGNGESAITQWTYPVPARIHEGATS